MLLILPLSMLLYACPFESTTPLEPGPVEPVDSSLFGFWYGIVRDGSDFFGIEALEIGKATDSTYSITRYGKAVKGDIISPDTTYFTGYTSYLGEQRFMNLESSMVVVTTVKGKKKKTESKTQKIYYLASFENRNDTLRVKTIAEDFSTRKNYKDPAELKQMILTLSSQNKKIFDDLYSQSYRKIPKPAHF
jgi:hypothetical protein